MDENTNLEQQTADQQDAFLSGWDEDAAVETANQPEETGASAQDEEPETTPAETDGAESKAETEAVTEPTGEGAEPSKTAEAEPKEAEKPQVWIIKHMGEERTLSAKDITPELLQKGLDYDRVRGKYDEAKPVMEMFAEFAKSAGMSTADYARYIRAEAKRAGGMSEAEAKRAVELEDREAAVSAKEAAEKESREAKESSEAKIKADLEEFARAFPEVYEKAKADPKTIPQSVWNDVTNNRLSLTAAYSRYAIEEAQAQIRAANDKAAATALNQKNASRSTGSMKSAGSDAKVKDAFSAAFDEG